MSTYIEEYGVKVAIPTVSGNVAIHNHYDVSYQVIHGTLSLFAKRPGDSYTSLVRAYGHWIWMEPLVRTVEYEDDE
jgi:hypothetical protein